MTHDSAARLPAPALSLRLLGGFCALLLTAGCASTGGIQLFGRETGEGFDNDLFPTQGFVQLMMEVSVLGRH